MESISGPFSNDALAAPDIPPTVARRAVQWILELQTSDDPATTANAIRSWCAQHPDHQRAWAHVEQLNQRFDLLADPERAGLAQKALTASGLSRRHALKTLSLLLVAGAAGYGAKEGGLFNRWQADHYTAVGEQRTITLASGTEIILNSASAIELETIQLDAIQTGNSQQAQRIHLLKGEIYISSGPRQTAPLVVQTTQGSVRPLGTRFALRQLGEACRLAVYAGQVELSPRQSDQRCLLNPGETTLFSATGWSPFNTVQPDEAAWTEGVIVVRAMPLEQFIAELSRYRPGILRVDPAVAQLTVSGTYPVIKTDQVLHTLAAALPIKLHSVTRYWVTVVPA